MRRDSSESDGARDVQADGFVFANGRFFAAIPPIGRSIHAPRITADFDSDTIRIDYFLRRWHITRVSLEECPSQTFALRWIHAHAFVLVRIADRADAIARELFRDDWRAYEAYTNR